MLLCSCASVVEHNLRQYVEVPKVQGAAFVNPLIQKTDDYAALKKRMIADGLVLIGESSYTDDSTGERPDGVRSLAIKLGADYAIMSKHFLEKVEDYRDVVDGYTEVEIRDEKGKITGTKKVTRYVREKYYWNKWQYNAAFFVDGDKLDRLREEDAKQKREAAKQPTTNQPALIM